MARYVKDVNLHQPTEFVNFMMEDFLRKGGYAPAEWKTEACLGCGDSMEGYKYLKWSYINGIFHLEAWMKGMFGGEMGLTGFVSALPKKIYKDNLEALILTLQQSVPDMSQVNTAYGTAAGGHAKPIPVVTVNNIGQAKAALMTGIMSIPGGLLIPLVGIVLGAASLSIARSGMNSSRRNLAAAGRICAIVGLVLSMLNWFLAILLMYD